MQTEEERETGQATSSDVPAESLSEKLPPEISSDTKQVPGDPSEEKPNLPLEPNSLETELAELNDKYLRLAAEYDNYRKRTQREKESLFADAQAATIEKFLPVCDNLDRALAQQTEDTAFYAGIELIRKGLTEILGALDVRQIDTQGQPFDPNVHNAVMHIEDDSGEENMVAEVFKTGYIMGERVIRYAVVSVKN